MTEAMPFLQKTILLSYDPRSLPEGAFPVYRRSPFPRGKGLLSSQLSYCPLSAQEGQSMGTSSPMTTYRALS